MFGLFFILYFVKLSVGIGFYTIYDKAVIKVSLWFPWKQSYHSNRVFGWSLLFQGRSVPNMNSIVVMTKELLCLPWQPRYHSNVECEWCIGWCLISQICFTPNMNLIPLTRKKLLRFHCTTDSNHHVADGSCLKEILYKIWIPYDNGVAR